MRFSLPSYHSSVHNGKCSGLVGVDEGAAGAHDAHSRSRTSASPAPHSPSPSHFPLLPHSPSFLLNQRIPLFLDLFCLRSPRAGEKTGDEDLRRDFSDLILLAQEAFDAPRAKSGTERSTGQSGHVGGPIRTLLVATLAKQMQPFAERLVPQHRDDLDEIMSEAEDLGDEYALLARAVHCLAALSATSSHVTLPQSLWYVLAMAASSGNSALCHSLVELLSHVGSTLSLDALVRRLISPLLSHAQRPSCSPPIVAALTLARTSLRTIPPQRSLSLMADVFLPSALIALSKEIFLTNVREPLLALIRSSLCHSSVADEWRDEEPKEPQNTKKRSSVRYKGVVTATLDKHLTTETVRALPVLFAAFSEVVTDKRSDLLLCKFLSRAEKLDSWRTFCPVQGAVKRLQGRLATSWLSRAPLRA